MNIQDKNINKERKNDRILLEKIYTSLYIEQHEVNEIHDSTYDKVFKVGGEYHLESGDLYTVNKISNLPPILYVTISTGQFSGRTRMYPIELAAKWEHQFDQSTIYQLGIIRLDGDNYYILMGIIAKHGRIEIATPEKFRTNVELQYSQITGKDLADSLGGPYQVVPTEQNRWFPSAKATVPLRFESIIKGLELSEIKYTKQVYGLNISNTKYIWTLIHNHKFLVGRNDQRINEIEQTIPKENKEAFLSGIAI